MKYLLLLLVISCSYVPPGNVGIKINNLGGDKGVDTQLLEVGRYWIGWNENLYIFPVFQQNTIWTQDLREGSPTDESITFNSKEGLEVATDIGISYHLEKEKIVSLFQKYRRGVDEITSVFLRNYVRDALNNFGGQMSVEEIYGPSKKILFDKMKASMAEQLAPQGIILDNIYLIGSFRLPENVIAALNSKIQATQQAQQFENEVRGAKAQAEKEVAVAEGQAKARLIIARTEAEANKLKAASISKELVNYEATKKWNGVLPTVTGGHIPFINMELGK